MNLSARWSGAISCRSLASMRLLCRCWKIWDTALRRLLLAVMPPTEAEFFIAVCCIVLQWVAVGGSLLQCVAVCCSVLQRGAFHPIWLRSAAFFEN